MNVDLIVVGIAAMCNLALTGFVVLRNPRGHLNQAFGGFGLCIVLWTVCNFGADHIASQDLILTRLTLFFGAGIMLTLFLTCSLFPSPKRFRRRWFIFYAAALAALALCLTPLFVLSVTHSSSGAVLKVGSLYPLYGLYMLTGIVWSMLVLLRLSHPRNRAERGQVRLFGVGIIIGTSLAFLTNILLPVLVDSWGLSHLGPIFTIPFVALTSYAIIKHRMFDMRLAVTRTIGFLATVGIVGVGYSILVL